jgi:hypothetical protein
LKPYRIVKNNVITIIIGGDTALSSAQFKAYEIFENQITVAQIASKVVWDNSDVDIHKTYLERFLFEQLFTQV